MKRTAALILLVCMLFCFSACGGDPVTPPAGDAPGNTVPPSGDTPGEGEGTGVNQTVTVSGNQYAAVGETVRLTLRAGNCDLALATVVAEPATAATVEKGENGTYSVTVQEVGTLTLRVTCEGATATHTVTVVSAGAAEYTHTDSGITYFGRTESSGEYQVFRNTATGFRVTFYGTKLVARIKNVSGSSTFAILVDGATDPTEQTVTVQGTRDVVLFEARKARLHTVEVRKITEESISVAGLLSLTCEGGELLQGEKQDTLKIEFYGDSITSGYGNMRPAEEPDNQKLQNGLMTYATIAARRLGADYSVFSKSGIGLYTNPYKMTEHLLDVYHRLSPDSPADSVWDMGANAPDIAVINIGTNDCMADADKVAGTENAVYTPAAMQAAYVRFIEELEAAYGGGVTYILVGGMMLNNTNSIMVSAAEMLQLRGIDAHVLVLPQAENKHHPMLPAHEAAADVLYDAIRDILKEKEA